MSVSRMYKGLMYAWYPLTGIHTSRASKPKNFPWLPRIPQLEKSWFVELFGTKDQIGICNLPDRVKKTPQLGATTI